MCGPSDNSGRQLKKQERKRQEAITQGTGAVNAAFAGFTPDYFASRGDAFKDFYLPQVEAQGKAGRAGLIYDLGRTGLIDSSVGAKRFADLQGTLDSARKGVIEGSLDYQNQLRAQTEKDRASLIQGVEQGAGVQSAAALASANAQLQTLPPAFSPLGDLFSQFTQGALYNTAATQAGGQGNPFYNQLLNLLPGQGSGQPKPNTRVIQ